jgi:transposase-like protein
MGAKVKAWEKAGRARMRSPGRPPVGRMDHRRWFWQAIARGDTSLEAAAFAGVSGPVGVRWFREGGGMPTVSLHAPSARYLCFAEREDIALLRAEGKGVREIAREIGRSPSTISRELRRNAATRSGRMDYRASVAQWHAEQRAKRPKAAKLAVNDRLREYVAERLAGQVRRPDGKAVPGPVTRTWNGRNKPRRQDRRLGERLEPGADLGPLGAGLPR